MGSSISHYGGLTPDEHACLERYCGGPGDHIEFGTWNGGSAHTVAQCKKSGVVTTLDINVKHYDQRAMGPYQVILVQSDSRTWIPPQRYETAFIDGGHDLKTVTSDWNKLKQVVDKYILFHDMDLGAVAAVVNSIDDWALIERCDKIAVMEKQ